MSVTSAMYTGVSGLLADSEAINVIGNNLANLNTVGFKGASTVFSDLLSQNIGNGSQIGTGTKIQSVQNNFTQGAFVATQSATDLAISGNSFFAVKAPTTAAPVNQNAALLTRAGSFTLDSNLNLVNPDGYQVLDTQGNPIQFSANTDAIAAASKAVAGATPQTDTVVKTQADAQAIAAATLVTKLAGITPAAGPPVLVAASATETAAAAAIATAALAAQTAAAAAAIPAVVPATAASNTAAAQAAFTTLNTLTNSSIFTTSPGATGGASVLFAAFKTALNSAYATAEPVPAAQAQLATATGLAFSKITSIDSSGLITYLGADGTTSNYYNASGQAGLAANAANAATVQRLAVVNVVDPTGLAKVGGNLYQATAASGVTAAAFSLAANTANGTSNKINSNNLEQSTVDMASEFVNMLTVQRAYSANSKTITTADEMTQEVLALIR